MPDDDYAERKLRDLLRDPQWSLPSWPDAPSRIRRAARRQRLRVAGLAASLGAVALAAVVVPVSQLGGGTHPATGLLGPAGPPTAYVLTLDRHGDYGQGVTVTPINTATNKAGRPVRTPGATEMVVAPDGRAVYVNGTSGVTVISTATNRVARVIPLRPARQMAITPDGKTLYVCSGPAVVPVSTTTGRPGRPIQVSRRYPWYIAVTPDGRTAYVTTNHSDEVSPIQVATGRVLAPVDVGGQPGRIAIAPAGHMAYFGMKGQITPVDTSTNTALKPIKIHFEPGSVAFTPDAKTAYVTDQFPSDVIPIRVATGTALPPITLPGNFTAFDLAITPDGKTAYASMADMAGNLLLPISTVTRKAQAPIKVGYSPYVVAVTPDGKTVYVGESALQVYNRGGKTLAINQGSQVTPVRTATNQPGRPIKMAGNPAQIVISP
jgi:YVTN family beta-propeller protein